MISKLNLQAISASNTQGHEVINALAATIPHAESVLDFAKQFTAAAHELLGARLTSLWSVDPVNRKLLHSASIGATAEEIGSMVLDTHSYSWVVVESKRVHVLPLDESIQHHLFQHPHLIINLGIHWMVSIPVLNVPNHNQVTHCLNFFFIDRPHHDLSEYVAIGEFFASRYEEALHERCFRVSNLLHIDLAQVSAHGILSELCRSLVAALEERVPVDAAAVYIRGDDGNIKPLGFTTFGIREISNHATICQKLASAAIETNREKIFYGEAAPKIPGTSQFKRESIYSPCIVAVPVRNLDAHATAAILCLRPAIVEDHQTQLLTYDDITLVEVMGQSFAPYLELLLSGARRFAALNRLGHEMNGPLAGIRAAAEVAEFETTGKVTFGGNYFRDLNGYLDSIVEIVSDFELGIDELSSLVLRSEQLNIVTDLFAPTMRAVTKTIKKRGFNPFKVSRPGLSAAPRLWLDRSRMLRVILNLLDNAIKYSRPEPAAFEITVRFAVEQENYAISVRDNGIGVPRGFEKRIFSAGIRSPNALKLSATGKGLGLSIARNIILAHGGDLVFRRPTDGSEFVILLPKYLRERPPTSATLHWEV